LVARLHEAGGRPVEAHLAPTPGDGVGLEAGAVVDVEHGDLLPLADVGHLHESGVEGDRTHVVEVGVGDRRPVDLGLEHAPAHGRLPVPLVSQPWSGAPSPAGRAGARAPRLSMRRVAPMRAATRRRTSPCTVAGTWRSTGSTAAA